MTDKNAVRDFQFRKVDVDDIDDVIAIRRDIYRGRDYLPYFYKSMMTNHFGYAASYKGKLIAFECVTIVDDGGTMMPRALRISEEYEGQGVIKQLKQFIDEQHKNDKSIKRKAYSAGGETFFKKVLDGSVDLIVTQDRLTYVGNLSRMLSVIPASTSPTVKVISKEELKALLRNENEAQKLFPYQRLIIHWKPYRLLESNVDHFYDESCNILGSASCDEHSFRVDLLTMGVGYPAAAGVAYNLEIYGEVTEDLFSLHIAEHIRKCSVFGMDNISFLIHYKNCNQNREVISRSMERFEMTDDKNTTIKEIYFVEELVNKS